MKPLPFRFESQRRGSTRRAPRRAWTPGPRLTPTASSRPSTEREVSPPSRTTTTTTKRGPPTTSGSCRWRYLNPHEGTRWFWSALRSWSETACLSALQMEAQTSSSDNISQFSVDSITSLESKEPMFIAAGDIRYAARARVCARTHAQHQANTKPSGVVDGVCQKTSLTRPPRLSGTPRTRRQSR